jgi:hypothetical protein
MQEVFKADDVAAFASIRDRDRLLIGISFIAKSKDRYGTVGRLDKARPFDFSVLDICSSMKFPYPPAVIEQFLTAIGMFAKDYRRVVTYGASVGGFLALNLASYFGAQAAIVASPQFAFDPTKRPEGTKASRYQAAVTNYARDDIEKGLNVLKDIYLLHDPYAGGAQHTVAIAQASQNVHLLPVRFAGHPVSRLFEQGETLHGLLDRAVRGTLAPSDVRNAIVQSRSRSRDYLKNLALAQPLRRDALRVHLLEKAHELLPSASVAAEIVPALRRLGRNGQADAVRLAMQESEAATRREMAELKRQNAKLQRRVRELKRELIAARSAQPDAAAAESLKIGVKPTATLLDALQRRPKSSPGGLVKGAKTG